MMYASPTWSSARSAYKAYTFKKDDAQLLDGTTEVVYDATNTNFNSDWNGISMALFEASSENLATLNYDNSGDTCEYASKLRVYYEWRSSQYDSMSWLENPNDANDKKFMAAPLQLQGQMPTGTGAIPSTPSGTNYAGANLNLRYEGGCLERRRRVSIRKQARERRRRTTVTGTSAVRNRVLRGGGRVQMSSFQTVTRFKNRPRRRNTSSRRTPWSNYSFAPQAPRVIL